MLLKTGGEKERCGLEKKREIESGEGGPSGRE